jgi:three-Cys-motif partner protein
MFLSKVSFLPNMILVNNLTTCPRFSHSSVSWKSGGYARLMTIPPEAGIRRSSMQDPVDSLPDDGFLISDIKRHSLDKYSTINLLVSLFTKAIRRKWDCLVYIDLFAGPGRAQVKPGGKIVKTSPIIALEVNPPFDLFILSEKDRDLLFALDARISRDYPLARKKAHFLGGDCIGSLPAILSLIPKPGPHNLVLSFCLIDPYKAADFSFTTIRILSRIFIDFLVLIPDSMDIQRNLRYYIRKADKTIDNFLEDVQWREEWKKYEENMRAKALHCSFSNFILEQFNKKMSQLGFKITPEFDMVQVTQADRSIPLYKLAFYSKSNLGMHLFQEAKKYSSPQKDFFDKLKAGG